MTTKELAIFVLDELNNAHEGVLYWSEADCFIKIYEVCNKIINDTKD